MKTKNRAAKAKISKVPSRSSSRTLRVLNQVAKLDLSKQDHNPSNLYETDNVLDHILEQDLMLEGHNHSKTSPMERSGLAIDDKEDNRIDGSGGNATDTLVDTDCQKKHGAAKRLEMDVNDFPKSQTNGLYHDINNNKAKGDSARWDGHHILAADSSDGIVLPLEKQGVVSSQNIANQDSLQADWSHLTEQRLCIKCDKGNEVLICSNSFCPLAVHEKCMQCLASFDDVGNFYCPYCSYKRAISKSCRAKEKANLARKSLSLFFATNMMPAVQQGQLSETTKSKEPNQSMTSIDGNHCHKIHENRQHRDIVARPSMQELEDRQEADAADQFSKSIFLGKGAEGSLSCERNNNRAAKLDSDLDGKVAGDNSEQVEGDEGRKVIGGDAMQAEGVRDKQQCREEEAVANDEAFNVVLTKVKQIKAKIVVKRRSRQGAGQLQAQAHETSDSLAGREKHVQLDGDHQHSGMMEDQLLEEPSIARSGGDLPCEEESTLAGEVIDVSASKRQRNNQKTAKKHQGRKKAEQLQAKAIGELETSDSPSENVKTILSKERHAEQRVHNPVAHKQGVDPPDEATKENAEENDERGVTSDDSDEGTAISGKLRKRQRPSESLYKSSFPNLRRQKLRWTAEEEEMLKEGVQKFSTPHNTNVPWRKILEFGSHVFDKTRNPVDLKDKWRNLVKEGSKAKRS